MSTYYYLMHFSLAKKRVCLYEYLRIQTSSYLSRFNRTSLSQYIHDRRYFLRRWYLSWRLHYAYINVTKFLFFSLKLIMAKFDSCYIFLRFIYRCFVTFDVADISDFTYFYFVSLSVVFSKLYLLPKFARFFYIFLTPIF